MVIKRVVVFGVVWLVSFAVTVGVLTVAAGDSEANSLPPPPPGVRADGSVDESKLPNIVPVGGPGGRQLGWTYESWGPDSFPAEPLADSEHSRRIFDDQGETLVIEGGATGFVGGVYDHPIFSTREEAERYRDSLLAGSGSGGAPVNVND